MCLIWGSIIAQSTAVRSRQLQFIHARTRFQTCLETTTSTTWLDAEQPTSTPPDCFFQRGFLMLAKRRTTPGVLDDRRRLDMVIYGVTPWGGALCCDATLVSLPSQGRSAELLRNGPQTLVVLGSEIGGTGALALVRDPVRLRRLCTPPALRNAAATAWARRWWIQLSVAVQRATALSAAGHGQRRLAPRQTLRRSSSCWTSPTRGPSTSWLRNRNEMRTAWMACCWQKGAGKKGVDGGVLRGSPEHSASSGNTRVGSTPDVAQASRWSPSASRPRKAGATGAGGEPGTAGPRS